MTNDKLMIAETRAKAVDRFAILRETPARQSKPAVHAAPVHRFVYPANVAVLESLVLHGRFATLACKDFSEPGADPSALDSPFPCVVKGLASSCPLEELALTKDLKAHIHSQSLVVRSDLQPGQNKLRIDPRNP